VLGCVIAAELYARYPQLDEGHLTRLRAKLVREEALVAAAAALGLAAEMHLGEGESAQACGVRASILADAFEALLGAIYLDGGYAAARDAVLQAFRDPLERIDTSSEEKDAKTRLQEVLQAARRPLPSYRVLSVQGAAHQQTFEVECALPDAGLVATGQGSSRQRAEQQAAERVLAQLEG
jgi:ribonuclease-3